ncbi:hypothetical protein cypCar_00006581 [Cyprinus carpio]|nr:hypothetical protein cypCar_00006581 [Cyprinus carpio]
MTHNKLKMGMHARDKINPFGYGGAKVRSRESNDTCDSEGSRLRNGVEQLSSQSRLHKRKALLRTDVRHGVGALGRGDKARRRTMNSKMPSDSCQEFSAHSFPAQGWKSNLLSEAVSGREIASEAQKQQQPVEKRVGHR